jgi:hypothetical protein
LQDPSQFVDELLAATIAGLDSYVDTVIDEARDYAANLGLELLPRDVLDAIRADVERNFLDAARPALASALIPVDQRISDMLDAGVSPSTITAALSSDLTRDALLAGFVGVAKSAAATYIQELDRAIAEAAADATVDAADDEDGPPNFEWLAITDGKTCDDLIENSCLPRHNTVMTMDEWEELGRPGAANLICSIYAKSGSFCRCVLMESGKVGSSQVLNPIDVTDAIRAGKERAAHLIAA